MHQVLADAGKRRFLARAMSLAGAVAAGPLHAQTFIEDSPSSGRGWMPAPQAMQAHAGKAPLDGQALQAAGARDWTPADSPVTASPVTDWRQLLLAGERSIVMRRDDGPVLRCRYRGADGMVDRDGYGAACHVLRDVQANRMMAMDPRLLDILTGIQRWLLANGHDAVIRVLSGFRCAAANARTEGAAKNSMHLEGRAADILLEGLPARLLAAMVLQFNAGGGNGLYISRGFVHVDTGAARTWGLPARVR